VVVGAMRGRYASSRPNEVAEPGMNEEVHIDRIAEAGAAWEAAVRAYVRTWGRPADDGLVTPAEWRASEAERSARSAYEAERDAYRLHLRGDPHDEAEPEPAVDVAVD
jgi:hypothetical protein